jgi:hypothetical protein
VGPWSLPQSLCFLAEDMATFWRLALVITTQCPHQRPDQRGHWAWTWISKKTELDKQFSSFKKQNKEDRNPVIHNMG